MLLVPNHIAPRLHWRILWGFRLLPPRHAHVENTIIFPKCLSRRFSRSCLPPLAVVWKGHSGTGASGPGEHRGQRLRGAGRGLFPWNSVSPTFWLVMGQLTFVWLSRRREALPFEPRICLTYIGVLRLSIHLIYCPGWRCWLLDCRPKSVISTEHLFCVAIDLLGGPIIVLTRSRTARWVWVDILHPRILLPADQLLSNRTSRCGCLMPRVGAWRAVRPAHWQYISWCPLSCSIEHMRSEWRCSPNKSSPPESCSVRRWFLVGFAWTFLSWLLQRQGTYIGLWIRGKHRSSDCACLGVAEPPQLSLLCVRLLSCIRFPPSCMEAVQRPLLKDPRRSPARILLYMEHGWDPIHRCQWTFGSRTWGSRNRPRRVLFELLLSSSIHVHKHCSWAKASQSVAWISLSIYFHPSILLPHSAQEYLALVARSIWWARTASNPPCCTPSTIRSWSGHRWHSRQESSWPLSKDQQAHQLGQTRHCSQPCYLCLQMKNCTLLS